MRILAIDTSGKTMGIAVADEGGVLIEDNDSSGLKHSTALVSTIENILERVNLKFNDIDGFSVSIGPGSFTGLRVGVTTIKGFAFATKKPVAAVPTLDAIAYNCIFSPHIICPIIDARRNLVYACLYESTGSTLKRKSDYLLLSINELLKTLQGNVLFVGDGISIYREEIIRYFQNFSPSPFVGAGTHASSMGRVEGERIRTIAEFAPEVMWYPRASTIAIMGLERLKDGKIEDPDKLVPFYIYPTI